MPVRWLSRQTVSTLFADPLRMLPVRLPAQEAGAAGLTRGQTPFPAVSRASQT